MPGRNNADARNVRTRYSLNSRIFPLRSASEKPKFCKVISRGA